MNISRYTTLAELTKSQTADRLGIDNTPSQECIENLRQVCTHIFDSVREHFRVPILITSGYRSEELNRAIGGSKTSQHCQGMAIDIDAHILGGVTNKEIFEFIDKHCEYDQLIWEFGNKEEPAWVHVSFCENKNRKQKLVAKKEKDKVLYELYR